MVNKYHLFEVFGVELEYMIVNPNISVFPIADRLMCLKHGQITSDIENGNIAWSNELVAHVIELKTNGPTRSLDNLAHDFHKNVKEINALLQPLNAKLLGSACNPIMNPVTETTLWKHTYSEVYNLYNTIFDCTGHGWSNVQSTHINLPFYNDEEFEMLHAAIRLILPIIPGLSASSPILEGKITGIKDSRLDYYKTNQAKIPELTGKVIPEAIFNKADYYKYIFQPINTAIKPFDKNNILEHHFLNSRGAIARFDRNAIEIRLIDVQESPSADVAICALIIAALKALINEVFTSIEDQKKLTTDELFYILNSTIKEGEYAKISNIAYLKTFGLNNELTITDIWKYLYKKVKSDISNTHHPVIEHILQEGCLSTRIIKKLGPNVSESNIINLYNDLALCLEKNELFV